MKTSTSNADLKTHDEVHEKRCSAWNSYLKDCEAARNCAVPEMAETEAWRSLTRVLRGLDRADQRITLEELAHA